MELNKMRQNSILVLMSMLFILIAMPIIAQTQEVVYKDTIGNSQTATFDVAVTPDIDSIQITLYTGGEIDLDTLGVKFKYSSNIRYLKRDQTLEYVTAKNATYSRVLTINLDSAVVNYPDTVVVTIPKRAFAGVYNYITFYIKSASSGNDTADPGQKVVAIITKYD